MTRIDGFEFDDSTAYIKKMFTSSYDPEYAKYQIFGLTTQGYATDHYRVDVLTRHPMFDSLEFRKRYPVKDLMKGYEEVPLE